MVLAPPYEALVRHFSRLIGSITNQVCQNSHNYITVCLVMLRLAAERLLFHMNAKLIKLNARVGPPRRI